MSYPSHRRPHPVVAILGATATGKTDAAVSLARQFDGEVVSIDSRYLYRGLDIGTAKPTPDERQGIPHHLIDILDPRDDYSLALFQRDAFRAVDDVLEHGRLPILAGGTPLYVRAVLEGWTVPQAPPDPEFRRRMEQYAGEHGLAALHQELQTIDPVAAERTSPANLRRVIRALEVHHQTGVPMSQLEGKQPPPWDVLRIGLHIEREALFERVDHRADRMIEQGLIDEVRGLLDAGVPPDCTAMQSIGYQEVIPYLKGEYGFEEMVQRIKYATHRYVRHQLTWLRKTPDIHWFDALDSTSFPEIERLVQHHIRK